MSRVIKFRAWDESRKKMQKSPKFVSFKINSEGEMSAENYTPSYKLQQMPVMQFTGLLDANGVEIYEGDITEKTYLTEAAYSSGKHVRGDIVFHEQSFFERYTHGDGDVYYGKIDDCKVVGNIYQNPELLS